MEATEPIEALDSESDSAIDQDVCLWYGFDTMIELRNNWIYIGLQVFIININS